MEFYVAGILKIQLKIDSHFRTFLPPLSPFIFSNIARQVFIVNAKYITMLRLYYFLQISVSVKLSYPVIIN